MTDQKQYLSICDNRMRLHLVETGETPCYERESCEGCLYHSIFADMGEHVVQLLREDAKRQEDKLKQRMGL